MDPTFPLVPIANIMACLLIFLSISKNMFHSWNVGACSFAFWTALSAFDIALNSIVWSNSAENLAPVWCDISTHIGIASVVAIPAASFVIIRRLSLMISRGITTFANEQKMGLSFDLFLCTACPIIQMIFYYIMQVARFQILEEFGCTNAMGSFGLMLLLMNSMSIAFPLTSLIFYSPKLILAYFKHSKDFNASISSNAALSRNAFFKLFALGIFDIIVTLPSTVLTLVVELLQGDIVDFWPGWKVVHAYPGTVNATTAEEWKSAGFWVSFSVRFDQWINPVYAVIFFLLFGITESKRAWYRSLFWKCMRSFGFRPRVDPRASNIVFGSGAMAGSSVEGPRTIIFSAGHPTRSLGSVESEFFDGASKLEDGRHSSYGAKTIFDSASKEYSEEE